MITTVESASHQLARERFGRKTLADKYPTEYTNRWRDRREKVHSTVAHREAAFAHVPLPDAEIARQLGHDRREVVAIGAEAVQPDHAPLRRGGGFVFDGFEHAQGWSV